MTPTKRHSRANIYANEQAKPPCRIQPPQYKEIAMQDYIEELLDAAFEEFEDDDWADDYSDV